MMISFFKSLVTEEDSLQSRIFNGMIQVLILVSVVTFSLDTIPDLETSTRRVLAQIELVSVVIFSLEYALRVVATKRPLTFVFSFFGLVDLLAILPFYLALGIDLRSIRALRFLRLIRILKVARYSKAVDRFRRAFIDVKNEIVLFSFITLILLYLAAVGIYFFENEAQPEKFSSIIDSLWWAVATLTTVGYGDVYPITLGGKLFTFVILIVGLGIVSVPAGLIASSFSKDNSRD